MPSGRVEDQAFVGRGMPRPYDSGMGLCFGGGSGLMEVRRWACGGDAGSLLAWKY